MMQSDDTLPHVTFKTNMLNRLLFLICICLCFTLIVIGCNSEDINKSGASRQKASAVQQEGNKLYRMYLVAETNQVDAILKKIIQLGEASKITESERATWLYLAYSRFFAFEKRCGDQAVANDYFERARYWLYQTHEIARDTEDDVNASMNVFTPESCIKFVDNWDKAQSDGKGAYYLQYAHTTSP